MYIIRVKLWYTFFDTRWQPQIEIQNWSSDYIIQYFPVLKVCLKVGEQVSNAENDNYSLADTFTKQKYALDVNCL